MNPKDSSSLIFDKIERLAADLNPVSINAEIESKSNAQVMWSSSDSCIADLQINRQMQLEVHS